MCTGWTKELKLRYGDNTLSTGMNQSLNVRTTTNIILRVISKKTNQYCS